MTSRSLVQRSPTECDVSLCDLETSRMRRPWPCLGCCVRGGELGLNIVCAKQLLMNSTVATLHTGHLKNAV